MPNRSTAILVLLALCGSALAADPNTPGRIVQPAPRFTMLVRGQAPELISVLSIGGMVGGGGADAAKPSEIVYLDGTGARRTKLLSEVVALAPPTWVPTPETTTPTLDELATSDLPVRRLDLTDGERFVGVLTLRPGNAEGAKIASDAVFFAHEKLGTLAFPLDRVTRYWANARSAPARGARPLSGTTDSVLLANGDRLEGLVTKLGLEVVVEVTPAVGGATKGSSHPPATTIDCAHVELVNLVNPGAPLRTLRVDLADGTAVAADALAGDAQTGKLSLRALAAGPNARPMTMELSMLAGVVPNPSELIPLGSLPIAGQKAAPGRIGASPAQALPDTNAPLGAQDIVLPGPMSVEWAIPAGVGSVLGYAQMDDRSFAWGDCEVVVSIVGSQTVGSGGGEERVLARGRLNGASPSLTISSELGGLKPGDRLRVRTDSGDRGPIQDRVVLRRALLLASPRSDASH